MVLRKISKSPAAQRPPKIRRKGLARGSNLKRKFKPGRWVLIILILLFGGKYLWKTISTGETFNLNPENITLEGNYAVSNNEVVSLLDDIYGENILRIELKKISEKILGISRVMDVKVRRKYPDGLSIKIIERMPCGYAMLSGIRNTVNACGEVYPGTEGPSIEFKVLEPEKIVKLSKILNDIKKAMPDIYSEISAVDMNYRNEVIIYEDDYYIRFPPAVELDPEILKNNLFLTRRIHEDKLKEGEKLSYIDLRFIEYSGNGVRGAAIVK
ncbi:MAG: FtsQ-type POTRA domain-containing protein [Elusimicrobia bacterium]|nr:FtsQ-type POTRA domain-containing protein [Elusimicrobiota bacterium]